MGPDGSFFTKLSPELVVVIAAITIILLKYSIDIISNSIKSKNEQDAKALSSAHDSISDLTEAVTILKTSITNLKDIIDEIKDQLKDFRELGTTVIKIEKDLEFINEKLKTKRHT
jgi:Fic family protein